MSNVTIEVSPLKVAVIAAGVIALALGALTFHIAGVVKTTMWLSGVENFLYSFLTFGSRPIWLADIRNFAYLWFGFGTILILLGLFSRLTPNDKEIADSIALRESVTTFAKSKLTSDQNRALNDDIFKDIGDKVKSVFASVKSASSVAKPVASEKSVRVEPVLKSKE